jgi:hypothetical protein
MHCPENTTMPTENGAGSMSFLPPGYRQTPARVSNSGITATMIYTHVLNKGIAGVRSPADMLGRKHYMRPGNPFASLFPAIADEFASIVATRYGYDFEAAIKAFIKLHGKK